MATCACDVINCIVYDRILDSVIEGNNLGHSY